MEKRKRLRVLVLVMILVIFILMGISFARMSGGAASSPGILGTVLNPVQNAFSYVGNGVSGFFGFVGDMKNLQEENIELKAQLQELSAKLREAESNNMENERLRQLLELKSSSGEHDMVGCEVIAKDPGNWFYTFTVDKGASDGIQKNDTVVSGAGLVGYVTEVGTNWAQVQSIIDSESSVGALVSRTQDPAIVDGDLTLADSGKCKLNYVTRNNGLVMGDEIVTSGLGGVYPKGLLIGTVSEIKSDSLGYSQYAVVDTAVDFERIREVMVIRRGA